jgi:hypothetical protein
VAGQRPAAVSPAASGQSFYLATPPVWARRGRPYFLICFSFCLVLFSAGAAATDKAPAYTWLSPDLGHAIPLSVVGGLVSLALFAVSIGPVSDRQLGWAAFPLAVSFLSFLPFWWLAIIRRRARDWVVFAVYLAAATTGLALAFAGSDGSTAGSISGAVIILVTGIASVHALVAFRPAAGVPSRRDAQAARAASKSPWPIMDAVTLEDGESR